MIRSLEPSVLILAATLALSSCTAPVRPDHTFEDALLGATILTHERRVTIGDSGPPVLVPSGWQAEASQFEIRLMPGGSLRGYYDRLIVSRDADSCDLQYSSLQSPNVGRVDVLQNSAWGVSSRAKDPFQNAISRKGQPVAYTTWNSGTRIYVTTYRYGRNLHADCQTSGPITPQNDIVRIIQTAIWD